MVRTRILPYRPDRDRQLYALDLLVAIDLFLAHALVRDAWLDGMGGSVRPAILGLLDGAIHGQRIDRPRSAKHANDQRNLVALDVFEHQRRPPLLGDAPERLPRYRGDLPILVHFGLDMRQQPGTVYPFEVLAQ